MAQWLCNKTWSQRQSHKTSLDHKRKLNHNGSQHQCNPYPDEWPRKGCGGCSVPLQNGYRKATLYKDTLRPAQSEANPPPQSSCNWSSCNSSSQLESTWYSQAKNPFCFAKGGPFPPRADQYWTLSLERKEQMPPSCTIFLASIRTCHGMLLWDSYPPSFR